MASYHWSADRLSQVFVLPASVVDEALMLASPEQLRVLLWFSRHGQCWDAAACAKEVGQTSAQCESHLQFWLQQGMLQPAGEAPAAKLPVARPAAVKPVWQEVLAYQQEHREFSAFLEEVSARLGRPLSHGDTATLLYLTATAGMPQQAILLIVGYAISIGKPHLRYIETTALNWLDKDITTPDLVDEEIRRLQRCREAADWVERSLTLPRSLTAAQTQLADKWRNTWHFSAEMLQHAHTETVEKTGKSNLNYMDKILEHWHADGIRKAEQIPQPIQKKKGAAATNPEESGLDTEGFEEQLMQYRPKYKKSKT